VARTRLQVVAEVRPFEADDNGFWVLIAKEFNSSARYPIRTVVVSKGTRWSDLAFETNE
jgi:hypothetical protein